MEKIRQYIRKEIQKLHEQKTYPVPGELLDVMGNILQMRPLKRYVNNIKAINSIPPSYRIFLHNAQSFDLIYLGDQENNFKIKILGKEYDLLSREEKSLALGALSNLLTADLPPNFGKQDTMNLQMEETLEEQQEVVLLLHQRVQQMILPWNRMRMNLKRLNQNQI